MGERDVDAYLDSRKLNLDCKKAIEEAIRENFDGLHLKQYAAKEVVERFGEERMNFVMANTIRELSMMEDFQTEQRLGGAYRSPGKCQPGQKSEPGLCDRKPPGSFRWVYRHGKS